VRPGRLTGSTQPGSVIRHGLIGHAPQAPAPAGTQQIDSAEAAPASKWTATDHAAAATPAHAGLVETPAPARKDDVIPDDTTTIELSLCELREVAGYAAACARLALAIFERERPDDRRPRAAIDAAQAFSEGAERTKALRDSAWAAQRAAQEARDAGQAAASDAARAALAAAGTAFLHPLAEATQVKHILGAAAHAARSLELDAGENPAAGAGRIAQARTLAPPVVAEVLRRYPAAPRGGGRVGELIHQLDASLR
jgi:hypothetical protein